MKSYFNAYFDNFKGFSKEVWVLTLITYINRAGAMVMLFLTKYLHDNLFFNLTQIGWMLVCIGVGALFGNWIGGKLTDILGFYTIMLASLFLTGFGIISLMFLYDFVEICIGLFLVTAIADMYKPAMYVAVSNFTNRKNRTRALTLVRLAVNLGIVSGPIIAGLVIQKDDYDMLFWIDGLTCIIAISVFMLLIDENNITRARQKITRDREKEKVVNKKIKTDTNYIIFLLASFLTAFLFFQLFTTMPLYNSDKLKLNEFEIGMLLALNGLIIFLFEMPLIGFLERKKTQITKIILQGSVFMTSGFLFLLISKSVFVIIISIFLITLGQILLFSFSNSFAFTRAVQGQEGKYMAFYAMSFSAAQILSPKIGFSVIENFNYFYNWLLMGGIGVIGIMLYYKLDKNITFETLEKRMK
ncbi:MFS transporter [Flavobacterium psychrophilum]|uniref:MDR family MFS transporter n=1 Tax=Flavobacterium psychrophilum TaxID=96345 RepID=UPI000903F6E2|nr:MFS transporter [Flavobacterium psychrophilum]EKT4549253.1 MFS transporter [Flavobacterium psychrophilum]ELV7525294.1 MFS transporter [Flavobacterium psychrophilum]ELY2010302.1 MFS transporter [Flavobacterium psychrophilum]ELY2017552.1 MFS transporter [Flavobacterium psychrophilum]MCB6061545.1 MFS transporter [Flavobacterium psychrophilum]